jgi:putative membrane protein
MSADSNDVMYAWSTLTVIALLVIAMVYSLGWYRLHKGAVQDLKRWRLAAFWSGELLLAAIVASPLAHLDHRWLAAHMVQHLALMTVAAPLILLSEPCIAFLSGLPRCFNLGIFGTPLPRASFRGLGRLLTNPSFCWLTGTFCVLWWHVPVVFDLTLQSMMWHESEQAAFVIAGLLFWWPVIRPWPGSERWPRWSIPLYLFFATIPCDALSALLTFCGHAVYPAYLGGSQAMIDSALRDQELAGALMWVWVTFAYLVPAVVITIQCLSPGATLKRKSAFNQQRFLIGDKREIDGRI